MEFGGGAFIKCQCQGPTLDQLNHNLWGWGLDTGNVFSSSDGSNVQASENHEPGPLLLCDPPPMPGVPFALSYYKASPCH